MDFLRRRFSSSDLGMTERGDGPAFGSGPQRRLYGASAPSSPTNSLPSFMQGVFTSQRTSYNKDRCKTLLIIDDQHTDWIKYFRGRKLFGDWDIRLEQAEFSEINLAAYSDSGTIVDIQVTRNGSKVVRSFKPDFILNRQHVRDATSDWRNILLGLQYGGIPSINSLESMYNFLDKPWVFAQLVSLQRQLGADRFPLIDQSYYPNHKDLLVTPSFPLVLKIGHGHSGHGKVRVDNQYDFQDIASVVTLANCYSTTEPFIDTLADLHIQKIGNSYKAFKRKSISGNWKANIGSSMLEQVPVNETYKFWVDKVAQLFGGLDLVAIEAIIGIDGKEYIVGVSDSSMTLLGDSQEEDKKAIANLVMANMEVQCQPVQTTVRKTMSVGALHYAMNSPPQNHIQSNRTAQITTNREFVQVNHQQKQPPSQPPSQPRPMSTMPKPQIAGAPKVTPENRLLQPQSRPAVPPSPSQVEAIARDLEERDDTMTNLKKTFAGIFGDM